MNKIYRVVWNAELGQWVVASEVAKGRKKKASSATLTAVAGAVGVATLMSAGAASAVGYQAGALTLCGNLGQTTGRGYGANNSGINVNVICSNSQERFMLATTDAQSNASGNALRLPDNAGLVGFENGSMDIWAARGLNLYATTSLMGNRIVNLGAGVNGSDAVNLTQLKAVEAKITTLPPTGDGIDTSAVHYDGTAKDKVTLAGASGTTLTNLKDGSVASGSKDAVTGNQLFTTNQNVTNLTNNFNTLNTTVSGLKDDALLWNDTAFNAQHKGSNAKITNMAAGTVGATSTDAVNGSQLYGTANSVASALGGTNGGVNADGTVKAPSYKVGADSVTGVGGAIDALDKRISGISVGGGDALNWDATASAYNAQRSGTDQRVTGVANAVNGNDAVNKAQLDELVQPILPALKYVKFGTTSAQDAFAKGTDSVALGGNAFANADKALAIGANANVSGTNAVAIGSGSIATEANTFAVGGKLAAQRRRIVNVADGIADSDAATVGQVNAKFAEAVAASQTMKSSGMLKGSALLGATLAPTDLIKVGTTIKRGATATGTDSIAVGLETEARADRAIAMGNTAIVAAEEGVAIGQQAVSNGIRAVAIGSAVTSFARNSIAIGTEGSQVTSTGDRSIVIGTASVLGGVDTVGIGNNILSEGSNNVLLGNNATDDGRGDNIVSVGSTGHERQVVFVKAGTKNTDAVNVGQLKGVTTALGGGATVDATTGAVKAPKYTIKGKDYDNVSAALTALDAVPGADALMWDGTSSAYTAKHGGVNAKIANLAAGTVSATSTDAINGSQLYATNKTVSDAIGGTGAGLNADGSIKTPTFTVDFRNASGASRRLKGVAAGAQDEDAANVGQLRSALGGTATYDANGVYTGQAYTVTNADGSTSQVNGVGGALTNIDGRVYTNTMQIQNFATQMASGTIGLVQQSAAGANLTVGKDTDGASLDVAGTAGARKVVNVADGQIAAGGKEAVNGGQLQAVSQSMATALGGGASVNADGTVTAPTYTVTNADGSTSQVHTMGEVVNNIDGRVTSIDSRVTNIEGSVTNITTQINNGEVGLVKQDATTKDVTVAKDTGGTSVNIAGTDGDRTISGVAAGSADNDAVNVGQLKKAGVISADGQAKSVIAYDGADASSITLGGNGASQPVAIHNVADGVADHDAVNVGQLNQRLESKATEIVTQANDYTDTRISDVWGSLDKVAREVVMQDRRISSHGAMATAQSQMASGAAAAAVGNPNGAWSVGLGMEQGQGALSAGYARPVGRRSQISFGAAFSGDDHSVGMGFAHKL